MSKLYIDVGGTHLRCEIHSDSGIVRDTFDSSRIGLLAAIEHQIERDGAIRFIGVSYAGQVRDGYILSAPNIEVDEPAIKRTIEERYGIRLEIDNDLKCAARAERRYWDVQSLAVIAVGTGIGSAVIDEGRLISGYGNLAGEIGHIPYREAPFQCGCGRNNCLELYASGSGMRKWLDHYGHTESCDLARFRESGDEVERRIARAFEEALIYGAGTLLTMYNPQMVVLCGGVIGENPYLKEMIEANLDKYALKASLNGVQIVISALENGSLEGAKLLEEEDE